LTTIIDNINVFFGKWAFQNLSYFSHMKTPVLLLHGALGSAAMLEPLATQLQTADMPVRMMNFPGHGGLPLPESFSMPDFIQAVDEYTADWMPFKVFGYSMGGYVALLLAAMRPLGREPRRHIRMGDRDLEPACQGVGPGVHRAGLLLGCLLLRPQDLPGRDPFHCQLRE
jgi:pimeloyl-ACP methyl ester carboxylesterase